MLIYLRVFNIFVPVVKRGLISSLFSLLLVLLFIAGAGGLNLITHNCLKCSESSITVSVLIPEADHNDGCCENSHSKDVSKEIFSFKGTSCVMKVEEIKLTDYVPSQSVKLNIPSGTSNNSLIIELSTTLNEDCPIRVFPVFNKHGGQSIIILNRQLLT